MISDKVFFPLLWEKHHIFILSGEYYPMPLKGLEVVSGHQRCCHPHLAVDGDIGNIVSVADFGDARVFKTQFLSRYTGQEIWWN